MYHVCTIFQEQRKFLPAENTKYICNCLKKEICPGYKILDKYKLTTSYSSWIAIADKFYMNLI